MLIINGGLHFYVFVFCRTSDIRQEEIYFQHLYMDTLHLFSADTAMLLTKLICSIDIHSIFFYISLTL
jgi:hypothetical protein